MVTKDVVEVDAKRENLVCSKIGENKVHPWRSCPTGKHLVRTHPLHIPSSKIHPEGLMTTRHEHCAENPSHKDLLSYDEIQAITESYFKDIRHLPKAGILKFERESDFDVLIGGWVQYWNEVLAPKEPLDPNLVKALIATESSFIPDQDNTVNKVTAYGLMQITDGTLQTLGDHGGELKDHLIPLTNKNLHDASANICAGIRWLFRKKETASHKLHRTATWEEAVADYKAFLKKILNKEKHNKKPMNDFRRYYKLLNEG